MRPGNAALGLAGSTATMLLFNDATGLPEALLDGTRLTGMRTAAGAAAVADVLAPLGAAKLALLGAGLQAECHAQAMLAVRPGVRCVAVVNRSAGRAEDLAARLRRRHAGLQVVCCSEAEALAGAQLVCVCTNAAAPVLHGALLPPGCHVTAVGSYLPDVQEIDCDAVERAVRSGVAVVDSREALGCGDLAVRPLVFCRQLPAAMPQLPRPVHGSRQQPGRQPDPQPHWQPHPHPGRQRPARAPRARLEPRGRAQVPLRLGLVEDADFVPIQKARRRSSPRQIRARRLRCVPERCCRRGARGAVQVLGADSAHFRRRPDGPISEDAITLFKSVGVAVQVQTAQLHGARMLLRCCEVPTDALTGHARRMPSPRQPRWKRRSSSASAV